MKSKWRDLKCTGEVVASCEVYLLDFEMTRVLGCWMLDKDGHVVEKVLNLIGCRKREARWLKNGVRRVEMCVMCEGFGFGGVGEDS